MYFKSSPCPFVFTLNYLLSGHFSENADFSIREPHIFSEDFKHYLSHLDNTLFLEISKDVLGWPKLPHVTDKRQVFHFHQ